MHSPLPVAGAVVAVKVMQHKGLSTEPPSPASLRADSAGSVVNPVLEGILSVNICHPNLVSAGREWPPLPRPSVT